MKLNRTENTFRNLFWGTINKIITLFCPFIVRTIIIKELGSEYLGLSSLFTSILQMLSLSELGFSSAIVYSMYKPIAEDNFKKVRALLNFYKRAYRIIGVIILAVGLAVLPFLKFFISGDVPSDINIYVLYLMYLGNSVVSYLLFAYKGAASSALQRKDIDSIVDSIVKIFMFTSQIVALLAFRNYYLYYLFTPIATIIFNIARSAVIDKKYPQYFGPGELERKDSKEIWINVKALFVYKLGNTVSGSADNIVISSFLGLNILAIYNNYYYIISAIFIFLSLYYGSFWGGVGNKLALESKENNENTFYVLLLAQAWVVGWCSVCLLCLFQPFVELWVGKNMMLDMITVVLLVIYFYVWKINDIVYVYKDALGFWKKDKFRPLIAAIVNLTLNIHTVRYIGIYGVVLSTIISMLVIDLPWSPRILYKYYFKEKSSKYYYKLLKYAIMTAVVAAITYFTCQYISLNNLFVEFIIKIIICVVEPNLLFLFIFKKEKEFEGLKGIFTYLKRRRKNKWHANN